MSDDEYDAFDEDPADDSLEDFDTLVKLNKSHSETESSEETSEETGEDSDEPIENDTDIKSVSEFIQEVIVVKPENRRTSNIMSKFEMTNHIAIRAVQIAKYNNCMVDITGLSSPDMMAKRELMMRQSPLTLRRMVGKLRNKKTGKMEVYYEYWNPNEMMFATTYIDAL